MALVGEKENRREPRAQEENTPFPLSDGKGRRLGDFHRWGERKKLSAKGGDGKESEARAAQETP